MSIDMVVIQPYVLVPKLKKTKTKFLRCTGYLNSIKNYKARFIADRSKTVFFVFFCFITFVIYVSCLSL